MSGWPRTSLAYHGPLVMMLHEPETSQVTIPKRIKWCEPKEITEARARGELGPGHEWGVCKWHRHLHKIGWATIVLMLMSIPMIYMPVPNWIWGVIGIGMLVCMVYLMVGVDFFMPINVYVFPTKVMVCHGRQRTCFWRSDLQQVAIDQMGGNRVLLLSHKRHGLRCYAIAPKVNLHDLKTLVGHLQSDSEAA